jgi:broad specificity phosphatase PhoE
MTRFWWVRHGPTHRKDMIGWTDVAADLSDAPALERLSSHLPTNATVISSDLSRCRATAEALLGTRKFAGAYPDLRELHFGDWEERRAADLEASDPDLARRFWSTPGDVALTGGESWNAMSARVAKRVRNLCEEFPDRDVIAVAHLGVILSQIQFASGMDAISALSFHIDHLSVTRIDYLGRDAWRIYSVNQRP